jgi:hypothetical protein
MFCSRYDLPVNTNRLFYNILTLDVIITDVNKNQYSNRYYYDSQ